MIRYIHRWFSHMSAGAMFVLSLPAGADIRSELNFISGRQNLTGAANLALSADLLIRNANEPIRVALNPASSIQTARVTFYNPDDNGTLEGGGNNRYSERINSIEDAARNGRPVTIAADIYGTFGKTCNRRASRCLILIMTDGFDAQFPQYRAHFPQLPANSFIGIIEDTGSAFFGKRTKRLDLAARNARLARAVPSRFNANVRWMRMENPCGNGKAGRTCDFSQTSLAPTMLAMLHQ